MNSEIRVFSSAEETAAALASKLSEMINDFNDGRSFNIALSGGSTPKLFFQILASRYGDSADWHKVNFFWVDERCVPPDNPESNYGMTLNSLLDSLDIPADNVYRIMGESEPEMEALRYSEVIEKRLPLRNGLPFFDVILLGLGDDGHTASIFLGDERLFDAAETCAVAVNPYSGQRRITITGRIINNAGLLIFLVSGKPKAAIVREILEGKGIRKYPAQYVVPHDGRVIWYLDEDAALLLSDRKADC